MKRAKKRWTSQTVSKRGKKVSNSKPRPKKESRLEAELAFQMGILGIDFEREFRFHPTRRWRFDFAIPELKIAIEGEGLTNPKFKSRHTTNKGFEDDCEKYNSAAMRGWTVLRFTWNMIRSGYAIGIIERTIERRAADG